MLCSHFWKRKIVHIVSWASEIFLSFRASSTENQRYPTTSASLPCWVFWKILRFISFAKQKTTKSAICIHQGIWRKKKVIEKPWKMERKVVYLFIRFNNCLRTSSRLSSSSFTFLVLLKVPETEVNFVTTKAWDILITVLSCQKTSFVEKSSRCCCELHWIQRQTTWHSV